MAFELILQAASIIQDGQYLQVNDLSVWADATYIRSSYGLFLVGERRTADDPLAIDIGISNPLTASQWIASTPVNGRYSFKSYAFLTKDAEVLVAGDVRFDPLDGLLYSWDGATYTLVTLEAALLSAVYVSALLDLPILSYAYAHRNQLNLEYIKQVKSDTEHGAEQDKLYYARTNLDYFYALILGAEYNWSIAAYDYYYQIVINLNEMILTGKIS